MQTTQPSVTLWDGSTAAPTESLGYDGDGNVISSTDGAGDLTTHSYDPLGRLVSTVNPVGATTLYTYSATTLAAVQDPAGHVTTYGYDAAGQRTSATDPLGAQTQYGYDAVGNTTTITRPLDATNPQVLSVESHQYDALNALSVAVVQGSGEITPTTPQTTTTVYDPDGNAVQVQIAQAGAVTATTFITHTYDLADRLSATTYATLPAQVSAGQSRSLDAADNLTQQLDFNLYQHTRAFDGDNRLSQQVDSCTTGCTAPALSTTPSYDPNGNTVGLLQQAAGLGQTAAYTASYNAADWLTSQDDGQGATTYGYDAAGRVRTIGVAGGVVVTATIDQAGRTTALTDSGPAMSPATTAFTDTADNLPYTTTLPDAVLELRRYDGASRLASLEAFSATTSVAWDQYWALTRTPLGALSAITTATFYGGGGTGGGSSSQHFGYNALGQLAADADAGTGNTYQWSYDALGNLLQQSAIPSVVFTQYHYGTAGSLSNQLLATSGYNVASYGYDPSGNTTAITTAVGTTALTYTAAGRVGQVQEPDGTLITLSYNARGLRSSLVVTPTSGAAYTQTFSYQGDQVSQVSVTGPATFTEAFVYRPDGSPLELLYEQPGQPTQRYWYVLDGQGNVAALVDGSGALVNQYAYDVWGQMDGLSTVIGTREGILQPLRYRGYWYDGWYAGASSGGVAPHVAGAHGRARGALRPGTRLEVPPQRGPLPARMGLTVGQWRALPAPVRAAFTRLLRRSAHLHGTGHPHGTTGRAGRGGHVAPRVGGQTAGSDAGPIQWYWLRTRYYDPALRRFLQPDPSSQDGVRSYVYCHDDPANCSDPSGLAGYGAGSPGQQLPLPFPPTEAGAADRPVQLPLPQLESEFSPFTPESSPSSIELDAASAGTGQAVNTAQLPLNDLEEAANGRVDYGRIDAQGRRTGIRALLTGAFIDANPGTEANSSIRPPGYVAGINFARGHLLARQLGGSGDMPENLVTLYQSPANSPVMRKYETDVRGAIEAGEAVSYDVTPIYEDGNPMPRAVTLNARGSRGFDLYVTVLNQP